MPSESNAGLVAGLTALFAASGETVTYRRDSTEIEVTAVLGESKSSGVDRNGQRVTYRTRDYLVAVEDMVMSSAAIRPKSGDKIIQTVNGVETQWHVMDGMSGGDCFRYVDDATRTVFRIHTQEK